jgi:hypothetical protein
MALSAVTAAVVRTQRVPGAETLTETDITCDNSYAEGGEPVTAAQLGLNRVSAGWCQIKNGSEAEANPVTSAFFDASTMLLHLNSSKTGKEVAKEVDCSKVVVRIFALGK